MTATIIEFPTVRARGWKEEDEPEVKLSCFECQNIAMGTKGLFCVAFREPIVHDDVAQECPEFEPF